MASASQRRSDRISQKLTLLKDQGDRLIGAVGQYVSEITAAGVSWMEGGDNKMEYLDLCQTIDSAVEFLWDRCEELADASAGVLTNQLSRPSSEQTDPIPHPKTATSSRQPTTLQTSTATTFNRQQTEIVQLSDEIQLKPALARIAVIEEAMCSLRGTAENVAEKQKDIDQQLTEVLLKLSDSDKKNNSRFRKVKEQIGEISDTQDALNQEHEARIQSLEKQVKKLNEKQDTMKVDMNSHEESTERLVHLPDQLESVKETLNIVEARICRIIEDCSNKHQEIEMVTCDLKDKVIATRESVQVISDDQEQKTTLLRKLETRLQTLEADSERNVNDIHKQVEKREANFRILCQMLNDRLTPLEQLRTCLNQRASTRDKHVKMLTRVIQEVAELKSPKIRCGFAAKAKVSKFSKFYSDSLSPYEKVYCNVGGNLNADTGIFTAPVRGLYVTSVSTCLHGVGKLRASVMYDQESTCYMECSPVCESLTEVRGTHACSIGVVEMNQGETLHVSVDYDNIDLKKTVRFSCFLLA